MHAEYLVIYQCGQRQIVKQVSAVLPNIQRAVLPKALVIKSIYLSVILVLPGLLTIYLSYLSGLMVSSEESHSSFISDFEDQKHEEGFHTIEASVYKIPHKQISYIRGLPSDLEELQQIIELPMDISTDSHRRIQSSEIGLFGKNIFSSLTQLLHSSFFYKGTAFNLRQQIIQLLHVLFHLPSIFLDLNTWVIIIMFRGCANANVILMLCQCYPNAMLITQHQSQQQISNQHIMIGLLSVVLFLHISLSTLRWRKYLQANQQEPFLPLDIVLELILGVVLAIAAVLRITNKFKGIREFQQITSYDQSFERKSFKNYCTSRGALLLQSLQTKLNQEDFPLQLNL